MYFDDEGQSKGNKMARYVEQNEEELCGWQIDKTKYGPFSSIPYEPAENFIKKRQRTQNEQYLLGRRPSIVRRVRHKTQADSMEIQTSHKRMNTLQNVNENVNDRKKITSRRGITVENKVIKPISELKLPPVFLSLLTPQHEPRILGQYRASPKRLRRISPNHSSSLVHQDFTLRATILEKMRQALDSDPFRLFRQKVSPYL